MNQNLKWKGLFILLIVLGCLWGLFARPSFPTSWQAVKDNFQHRIHLGLDLQGGSHLVLQVEVEQAVRFECDRTIDDLTHELHKRGVQFGDIQRVSDTQILVKNLNPTQSGTLANIVQNQFPDWQVAQAAGQPSGFMLTLNPAAVAQIKSQTMQQAIETIRVASTSLA